MRQFTLVVHQSHLEGSLPSEDKGNLLPMMVRVMRKMISPLWKMMMDSLNSYIVNPQLLARIEWYLKVVLTQMYLRLRSNHLLQSVNPQGNVNGLLCYHVESHRQGFLKFLADLVIHTVNHDTHQKLNATCVMRDRHGEG